MEKIEEWDVGGRGGGKGGGEWGSEKEGWECCSWGGAGEL